MTVLTHTIVFLNNLSREYDDYLKVIHLPKATSGDPLCSGRVAPVYIENGYRDFWRPHRIKENIPFRTADHPIFKVVNAFAPRDL